MRDTVSSSEFVSESMGETKCTVTLKFDGPNTHPGRKLQLLSVFDILWVRFG